MSGRHLRALGLCLSLLAVSVVSASATAQTSDDLERAKASFKAGAAAYAAGEYAAAIQALETAYALTPLPAITFSLAQAERRQYFVARELAHLQRAVTLFRSYVADVPTGGRSADALDALSQLEPLLATESSASARGAAPVAPTPTAPSSPTQLTPRPTRLMITSETPAARISVDGQPALPSPLIHAVAPGPHRVVVEATGYFSTERVVTALPGELILSEVSLRELPGTLVVATSSDAELYIDGTFVSHGGERTTLAIPSGPHVLTVAQLGRRVAHRSVMLERGGKVEVKVSLSPTLQRRFARAMFGVGGTALGGGLLFGALAYREQGHALDFLAKQKRANVTQSELSDYEKSVRQRDNYRLAAGLSLSVAAAVFVSALLMHELDRPSSAETQRRGDPGVSASLRFRPQLELSPHGVANAGVGLQGTF